MEPRIHGKAVFYFNKENRVKIPEWDEEAWRRMLEERSKRLNARFKHVQSLHLEEIRSGNFLEALDLYYNLTLGSLMEALRLQYNPIHYDFKMRYVHYELPSEVLDRLEHLYFVGNPIKLGIRYSEASQ